MVNQLNTGILSLVLFIFGATYSSAFTGHHGVLNYNTVGKRTTALKFGPFGGKSDEYNKVVQNIMKTKGLSEEEAKRDYDAYLENPNNYALNKGEAYYKDLGYKSLMDGVVGEAEKKGQGDEVRARIDKFKKESQLKGITVVGVFVVVFLYFKIQYDNDPGSTVNISRDARLAQEAANALFLL